MRTRPLPRLVTERLLLRPFSPSDGPDVERLAGAREVADTTLTIPHPYPVGGGTEWILTHADAWERDQGLTLAICVGTDDETPIGAISVQFSVQHSHGELGYWIGAGHWGQGYATEAAFAIMSHAFTALALHRMQARHFTRNPASGRVLQKLGMQLEGIHRDAYTRWSVFEDVAVYALLAPQWAGTDRSPRGVVDNF
ncbi:MAG: GNAT family N-acetyltransferase [Gemmatimonas sp.]